MNEARKQWYQLRVEQIHQLVTAYDVLRHNGIEFKQSTDDTEEQISCPFHGEDKKPSARIYPGDGGDDHSHVWCFVCQKPHWDAIGLWREFNGGSENCSFSEALSGIERVFGIQKVDVPAGGVSEPKPAPDQKGMDSYKALYLATERRLISCKPAYKHMQDMSGYLAAGSALDKVRFRVDTKAWSADKGSEVLTALLDKIREKVSQCPVG